MPLAGAPSRWRRPDGVDVLLEGIAAAALICLDPGHGTVPAIGRQREPIGPGSAITKIKDGGGAPREAEAVLAIAMRTRTLLLRRGYRVAMTRTGSAFRGGNIERARFCNRRGAALMLRIHADGSTDASRRGASTLYPARRTGWTDDVYERSKRAARRCAESSVSNAVSVILRWASIDNTTNTATSTRPMATEVATRVRTARRGGFRGPKVSFT